jgi:MoaA/NifB/PqqE/SkfB family radical SAM enzyme
MIDVVCDFTWYFRAVDDLKISPRIDRHRGKNRGRGLPSSVIWDVSYACPLRCVHCYSESGRRASRQLSPADILKLADVVVGMGVKAVFLSGGEPLIVKGLQAALERWAASRIAVYVFTSGWTLDAAKLDEIAPLVAAIHISVDGATAEVHDRIRQKPGSFDAAMNALSLLEAASRVRSASQQPALQFGIDSTLIQSNFGQLERIIDELPRRFPAMSFVNIGAAVPSGTASEAWFADHELLTEEQLAVLRRPPQRGARGDAGRGHRPLLSLSDQRHLQMHPDDVANGTANVDTLLIEPDGLARAMAMYEGTVGNLLVDPPAEIWARACARWHDPFVVEQLAPARTRLAWAAATRAIDQRFASGEDRARIAGRTASKLKVV